jgi:hypothetical protein
MRFLIIFLLTVVLVSGCTSDKTSEQLPEIKQLLENLPDGWTGTVTEVESFPGACGVKKPLYKIEFEYPPVVCKTESGGTENVSPSFTIYYFPKFTPQDWGEYVTCIAETGIRAAGIPWRFAETDEHTIMTVFGNSCPEKDNSEVEKYLNEFYGII